MAENIRLKMLKNKKKKLMKKLKLNMKMVWDSKKLRKIIILYKLVMVDVISMIDLQNDYTVYFF